MKPKAKILVVDDHKTVAKLMEAVLKLKGFEVLHAESGEQGLEMARRVRPALIFLDVMMPGIDGFQTCRALKADPLTDQIPVVFLTARGQEEDMALGRQAGGDGFIKKPFQTLDIHRTIEELVVCLTGGV